MRISGQDAAEAYTSVGANRSNFFLKKLILTMSQNSKTQSWVESCLRQVCEVSAHGFSIDADTECARLHVNFNAVYCASLRIKCFATLIGARNGLNRVSMNLLERPLGLQVQAPKLRPRRILGKLKLCSFGGDAKGVQPIYENMSADRLDFELVGP